MTAAAAAPEAAVPAIVLADARSVSLSLGGVPLLARQIAALPADVVTRIAVVAPDSAAAKIRAIVVTSVPDAPFEVFATLSEAAGWAAAGDAGTPVLLIDGPVLFDLSLGPVLQTHAAQGAALTVVAQPTLHPRESDLIAERDGIVTQIFPADRPEKQDQRNLSPAGIFVAAPRALPAVVETGGPLAALQTLLARHASIACHPTPEYVSRLDTPAAAEAAAHDIASHIPAARRLAKLRPALMVDVDGVLNEDAGSRGVLSPDAIVPIPGAGRALARARAAGFLTVAVTNRAQIARGDITFAMLDRILGRLEAHLAAEGGLLDRIYVCPHHPGPVPHGGVPALVGPCECRKPGTLSFRRAFAELPIDVSRTCMIGDNLSDIAAAKAVGIPGYGVRTGHACRPGKRRPAGTEHAPDQMFDDICAAVDFVLANRPSPTKAPATATLDDRAPPCCEGAP